MLTFLLKLILFTTSLGLLTAWYRATFSTKKFSSFLGLNINNTNAKSIVRGNIGGLYLSIFVMTVLFLFNPIWAYPLLTVVFAILFGRLVSFYFDGYSKLVAYATVIETFNAVILLLFSLDIVG